MYGNFLISIIYPVYFECLSLQYLAPKRGKKRKWKGDKKKDHSFKSVGIYFNQRDRGLQHWEKLLQRWPLPLCLHFCDKNQQSVTRAQISQYLENRVLSAYPSSYKLCTTYFIFPESSQVYITWEIEIKPFQNCLLINSFSTYTISESLSQRQYSMIPSVLVC